MVPTMQAAIAPPVQAMRIARCRRPAPTFTPTMAISAPPTPKITGIISSSSRAPMP